MPRWLIICLVLLLLLLLCLAGPGAGPVVVIVGVTAIVVVGIVGVVRGNASARRESQATRAAAYLAHMSGRQPAVVVSTPALLARPDIVPVESIEILISYRDVGGHVTHDRAVTVHSVAVDDINREAPIATEFNGYCHMRRQARSFRMDRLIRLADGTTGELARDPAGWLGIRALTSRIGR